MRTFGAQRREQLRQIKDLSRIQAFLVVLGEHEIHSIYIDESEYSNDSKCYLYEHDILNTLQEAQSHGNQRTCI